MPSGRRRTKPSHEAWLLSFGGGLEFGREFSYFDVDDSGSVR